MQNPKEHSLPRRTRFLGIIIGIAIGLLINAVITAWLRAPVLYFVLFTFGMIFLVPLMAGIRMGLMLVRGSRKELSWWALGMIAVISWSVAILFPFGIAWMLINQRGTKEIPKLEGAQIIEKQVRLGDNENTSDRVTFIFRRNSDSLLTAQDLSRELLQKGYSIGPAHFVDSSADGTKLWFRKGRATIRIQLDPQAQDSVTYSVRYTR
jgi:hypothetical protein